MCIYAVEAAKNRLFNRSGFSPAQRQFGYNMRLPGSLGSNDVYSPELLVQSSSDDMRRTLEIRSLTMQEFIKHTTSTPVARARRARGRGTPTSKSETSSMSTESRSRGRGQRLKSRLKIEKEEEPRGLDQGSS